MRMSHHDIDADAFRNFERDAHDEIADGYRDFFTAVTAYAVNPLLDAAACRSGLSVLDVATGPGIVAFRAAGCGVFLGCWRGSRTSNGGTCFGCLPWCGFSSG